jgi:hypothetical protein
MVIQVLVASVTIDQLLQHAGHLLSYFMHVSCEFEHRLLQLPNFKLLSLRYLLCHPGSCHVAADICAHKPSMLNTMVANTIYNGCERH